MIIGTSGFIVTKLLDKFIKDGYSVLNIDIVSPKK
jgi:nucleoside-diphosphate-sugar epimerase